MFKPIRISCAAICMIVATMLSGCSSGTADGGFDGGGGGVVIPYYPNLQNTFEGFDATGRRLGLQLFATAATQGQSAGTIDETRSSINIDDPPKQFSQSIIVSGAFNGDSLTLTFASASAPLGTSFTGKFVDTDTIELREAGAVVATLRRNGLFTAAISDNWNGTDTVGQPWLIQLGVGPGYGTQDSTSVLIGTEVRDGRASRITGFLSVRSVQLRIERTGGTVTINGTFPATGGVVNKDAIDFGTNGNVTRGGAPDTQRVVYVLEPGTEVGSTDLKGNQRMTLVSAPNFSASIEELAVSPDRSSIAYIVCGAACNLYLHKKSTGQSTQITTVGANSGAGVYPQTMKWSPDGTQLAFLMTSSQNGPINVYVMHTANMLFDPISGATVYNTGSAYAAWSPQNTGTPTLAYYAAAPGSTTRTELYIRKIDGSSAAVQITPTGTGQQSVFDFRWSADGNHLAFIANLRLLSTTELFVASANSGVFSSGGYVAAAPQPVPAGRSVQSFEWNPNGTQVAFLWNPVSATQFALYTVNAAGAGMTLASNLPGGPYAGQTVVDFAWSPDSLKLAFEAFISTNPADLAHGYVTSGTGGGVATQVAAATGGTNVVVWSPDSSRLVHTKWTGNPGYIYEFWSVKPDGTGASLLRGDGTYYCDYTALQTYRPQVAWSPDSKFVALAATADVNSGECSIFVMNPDGSAARALKPLTGRQLQVGEFRWLSDSTKLIYDLRVGYFDGFDEGLYVGYAADSASLKLSGPIGDATGTTSASIY